MFKTLKRISAGSLRFCIVLGNHGSVNGDDACRSRYGSLLSLPHGWKPACFQCFEHVYVRSTTDSLADGLLYANVDDIAAFIDATKAVAIVLEIGTCIS